MPVKRNFLFFHMKEHKIFNYLVPALQSFEDIEIKAKTEDTKQGNQSESIEIDQICDVTYTL